MGRQLASYGSNTYKYNEDGIRTSKTVNGVTTNYYLNGTDIIEQTDGTNTLHFYYDNTGEIVGFTYNNNQYFYIKNAQDDIVAIADNSGNIVSEYTYDPWGAVVSVTGSNTEIGNLNPFRYRSYYYDYEINMYYLQSRYYDPEICRFINCDDVNYIGVTESEISYNPFAYCLNNPVIDYDYMGTFSVSSIKKTIIKLFENLKKGFSDYMKSLIKKENGKISIHTDVIAVFINTIIKFCLTRYLVSSINAALKVVSGTYLKNHTGKAVKILKGVVDFLLNNNVGKTIVSLVASAYVKACGYKSGLISTLRAGILSNLIKIKSKIINKVSIILGAFSSIGNFIAFVLFDLVDKKIDGYFSLSAMHLILL